MKHLAALLLLFSLSACTRQPPPAPTPPTSAAQKTEAPLLRPKERIVRIPAAARKATVRRVTDGDTAEMADGEKVRLIGIDTPERDQPLYREATDLHRSLVEGKEVWLESDAEAKDKYKRTLAYVWVRDGERDVMVQEEILRAGLAYIYTRPPNVKYADKELLACQREAREAGRGIWKNYVLGGEDHYVATKNGKAFHRPSCKDVASSRELRRFKSQGEALDLGLHPCRNCKP